MVAGHDAATVVETLRAAGIDAHCAEPQDLDNDCPDLLLLCCVRSSAVFDPYAAATAAARKFQRRYPERVFVRVLDAPPAK